MRLEINEKRKEFVLEREARRGLSSPEESKDQTKKNNYFCIIIEKFFFVFAETHEISKL